MVYFVFGGLEEEWNGSSYTLKCPAGTADWIYIYIYIYIQGQVSRNDTEEISMASAQ